MIEEIIVPKLGMAAAVVTLTEWKVEQGGRIEKGDTIVDLEAEKSTFEMPAPRSGFVHILLPQGAEADVSTVIALLAETPEEYASLSQGVQADAPAPPAAAAVPAEAAPADAAADDDARGHIFITPVARRIAAEHGLDIRALTGSGPNGRIQKADVEKAIAGGTAAPLAAAPDAPVSVAAPAAVASGPADKQVAEIIPYRGMRKVIGENMMKSLVVNAPNTMSGDFDFTAMVQYREQLVAREADLGTRITYAELLIWAVSRALKRFPFMNSSLIDNEIKVWKNVNVGMAVALGDHGEKGLVVPIIREAGRKSLVEISQDAKALGEKARSDRLMPEDMSGGTFTVSVFGSVGVSSYSTPIINMPEAGILGIGRLIKKPIVRNDEIVIAPMLPYSLTHDHRIIDGAAAERFLTILKDIIENPLTALAAG